MPVGSYPTPFIRVPTFVCPTEKPSLRLLGLPQARATLAVDNSEPEFFSVSFGVVL